MGCFGLAFQRIFKFFYNVKPDEMEPKPPEFGLAVVKTSSELEDYIDKNINKGSSQEPLIYEEPRKVCSCSSCKGALSNEMLEAITSLADETVVNSSDT